MTIKHYRELLVWQKAMLLTKAVYEISDAFPKLMMDYMNAKQEKVLLQQADEIGKMLRGLQMKLDEKLLAPSTKNLASICPA